MTNSPVLFLIFNRLDTTKRVFNEIRKHKPKHLFIAADGPRVGSLKDTVNCKRTREYVMNNIDWDCEVRTLFRDSNIGCGHAVSGAISWFFGYVEEGVILEDDCLPCDSFFRFCDELLQKYRLDDRVSAISGNNFQTCKPMSIREDYYFSVFPSSWGWATWKRSWSNYDIYISDWNGVDKSRILKFLFKERKYQLWWKQLFDHFYLDRPTDTWDFQFHYLTMANNQYCIIPKTNLVSNIGHTPDGTHFHDAESPLANLPTFELDFPLIHPWRLQRNYKADVYVQRLLFGEVEQVGVLRRLKRFVKRMISYKV